MSERKEAIEAIEQFRDDLEQMREAYTTLLTGGLRRKTVLVLLSHHTKIPQRTIQAVLDGLETVVDEYFDLPTEED